LYRKNIGFSFENFECLKQTLAVAKMPLAVAAIEKVRQ